MHFLPFNPVDKRTALTYIDGNDNWHRVSKGAPEQVIFFPVIWFFSPVAYNSCIAVTHGIQLMRADFEPLQLQRRCQD